MFLLACSVCVISCDVLLCLAILNPFWYGCSQVDNRCGHASLALLRQSVQFGFGWVRGQNIFFLWLPMYWANLNFRVWVIWVYGIFTFFQKWLDRFWLICSIESHLSTYGNFLLASVAS